MYLSGRRSSDAQQFGTYSQDDVDALRAIAEDPGVVDLFLTYPFFDCDVLQLLVVRSLFRNFLNYLSLTNGQVGSRIERPHLLFLLEYQIRLEAIQQ